MSMLDFYASIMPLACSMVDKTWRVQMDFGDGQTTPFMIDGKHLALPARELMATPNDDLVFFHPLRENTYLGESRVMMKYRVAVNSRLMLNTMGLMRSIIDVAAQKRTPDKVSPSILEFLEKLKEIDKDTPDMFDRLERALLKHEDVPAILIFLRKNAKLGNESYRRGALVSFPLYEQLVKGRAEYEQRTAKKTKSATPGIEILGAKFRRQDIDVFIRLFELIFPDIATKEAYSRGDQSKDAPSLDALLRAAADLSACINDVAEMFVPLSDGFSNFITKLEWTENLGKFHQFDAELRMTPAQAGNEGSPEKAAAPQPTAPPVQPAPAPTGYPGQVAPAPVYQQPMHQAQPPASPSAQPGSWDEYKARVSGGMARPMMPTPYPQQAAPQGFWSVEGLSGVPTPARPMSPVEQIRATGRPAWEFVNTGATQAPQSPQQPGYPPNFGGYDRVV